MWLEGSGLIRWGTQGGLKRPRAAGALSSPPRWALAGASDCRFCWRSSSGSLSLPAFPALNPGHPCCTPLVSLLQISRQPARVSPAGCVYRPLLFPRTPLMLVSSHAPGTTPVTYVVSFNPLYNRDSDTEKLKNLLKVTDPKCTRAWSWLQAACFPSTLHITKTERLGKFPKLYLSFHCFLNPERAVLFLQLRVLSDLSKNTSPAFPDGKTWTIYNITLASVFLHTFF